METRSEVERLGLVYREYAARGFGHSKWSADNRGNQAMLRERRLHLRGLLREAGLLPLGDRRVLEVGCGTGEHLAAFQELGAAPANLIGIDLIPDRIRAAQASFPRLTFHLGNAEALPFAADAVDLVAVFTVFSSILDSRMAANLSREINRVLRPGGAVLWYDFRLNNPFNRHVRGIPRAGIQRLFPGFRLRLAPVTVLPPLARRLGPLTELLYPCLGAMACFRSHYLGLLTKP